MERRQRPHRRCRRRLQHHLGMVGGARVQRRARLSTACCSTATRCRDRRPTISDRRCSMWRIRGPRAWASRRSFPGRRIPRMAASHGVTSPIPSASAWDCASRATSTDALRALTRRSGHQACAVLTVRTALGAQAARLRRLSNGSTRLRLLVTLFALFAFCLQTYISQTHIHLAPDRSRGKLAQKHSAGQIPGERRSGQLSDLPGNPAQRAVRNAVGGISAAAGTCVSISPDRRDDTSRRARDPSHSWRSRAPPKA